MESSTKRSDAANTARDTETRSLRDLRVEALLSMRELAQLAGVAPSTVYLIEAGRTMPQPTVMRRLSAALAVEPSAVMEFERAIRERARMVRQERAHPRRSAV